MLDLLTFTNTPVVAIIIAALWGATEKMADLLDEHGLKLFYGSNMLFGVLWGTFLGMLVINQDAVISNLALAMLFSYILRFRIDYINHGIAAVIVLSMAFLFKTVIIWPSFVFFFLTFAIGGLIHDAMEEKPGVKSLLGDLAVFFEYRIYIYLLPLIYSIITGAWMAFFVASAHMFAYECVRQKFWRYKKPIIRKAP